jgi:hypothetical protein
MQWVEAEELSKRSAYTHSLYLWGILFRSSILDFRIGGRIEEVLPLEDSLLSREGCTCYTYESNNTVVLGCRSGSCSVSIDSTRVTIIAHVVA